MIFTNYMFFLDLTRYSKKKSSLILKSVLLGTAAWKIDGKVESAAVKCAAWNQAIMTLNTLTAAFSSRLLGD